MNFSVFENNSITTDISKHRFASYEAAQGYLEEAYLNLLGSENVDAEAYSFFGNEYRILCKNKDFYYGRIYQTENSKE